MLTLEDTLRAARFTQSYRQPPEDATVSTFSSVPRLAAYERIGYFFAENNAGRITFHYFEGARPR